MGQPLATTTAVHTKPSWTYLSKSRIAAAQAQQKTSNSHIEKARKAESKPSREGAQMNFAISHPRFVVLEVQWKSTEIKTIKSSAQTLEQPKSSPMPVVVCKGPRRDLVLRAGERHRGSRQQRHGMRSATSYLSIKSIKISQQNISRVRLECIGAVESPRSPSENRRGLHRGNCDRYHL